MAICKNCKYQYDGNFCPQCGAANDVNIPLTFLQEQEQTHSREFSEQSSIPVAPVKTEKKEKAHALLGFRTNKVWKKILSILYIIFCLIMFISLFDVSQDKHLSFRDIVVDKIGDIVFLFSIISPYIFLSNTKIRNKLPLFKNHKASLSFVGMLIVWTLCIVIGMSVDNFHSQQYEFDKENHSFTVIETVDPNCIDVGKIKKECDICKKIEVDEVAALGHDFSNGEKCLRCGKTKNELTQAATTKATKAQKTEKENKQKEKDKIKLIENEKTNNFIIDALNECNIDPKKVNSFKQIEDWAYGTRYTFTYNGLLLKVYCNADGTVNSINIGDNKIYDQGYEAYDISDYIVGSGVETQLIILTEDYVKSCLEYPETADFKTFEWAFGRNHNIYVASGKVEAMNGLGFIETITFKAQYVVKDEKIKLYYLYVDGFEVVNNFDEVETTERKRKE